MVREKNMKILKQENREHLGNDCMIYQSKALIESYGSYIVLGYEKIVGWTNNSSSNTKNFSDYNNANRFYNQI